MEKTSNDILTLFLIIAIVVSIGGTIISINRLNQLIPRITGFDTGTATGMVNVSVASVASVSITDSQIDFGSCTSVAVYGCNATSNATSAPCSCTGGTVFPDNITIRNDGTAGINVSVKTNVIASTMIGGSDPYGPLFMFSVRNATDYPGCRNASSKAIVDTGMDKGMRWDWTNFTAVNVNYLACANLTTTSNKHSIYLFAKIFIPTDAVAATDTNATLTISATNW